MKLTDLPTAGLALVALVLAALLLRPYPAPTRAAAFERPPAPAPDATAPALATPLATSRTTAPGRVEPGTTIVVLRVTRSGVTLVGSVDKTLPCDAPAAPSGEARWCLEDTVTGRLLAQGDLELPALCPCGAPESHADGCVVIAHEAVIRLQVPRLAPRERLLLRRAGRELASMNLEVRS